MLGFVKQITSRMKLGLDGENLACAYLKKNGYKIAARNWKGHFGELDIVATKDKQLIVIEVRTKASDNDAVDPVNTVTLVKRRKIERTTKEFVAKMKLGEVPVRFDVIGIVSSGKAKPEIRHIQDAFGARGRIW